MEWARPIQEKIQTQNSHGFTVCPRFHCLSHGYTVGSSFLTLLKILSKFFPKLTHSFLKKQTQGAHSNVKERISNMLNKNKTNIRSSLSLSLAILFI